MLDALAELKKYGKINLDNADTSGFSGSGTSAYAGIINGIAGDINRMSKALYKLDHYYESFLEEVLEVLHEKVDVEESYKSLLLSKENAIKEQCRRSQEDGKKIEGLLNALISLSDNMDIIYAFIKSSGDSDWISHAERIRNIAAITMAENGVIETGYEKYFDESLHEAVSAVEDGNRDFREIVDMEQKGYLYMGKVLRKARVIVNNYRRDRETEWQE